MSQQELLKRVAHVLDVQGVPYMVTGSFASSRQGAPQATRDIDLVVAITPDRVPKLLAAFPAPTLDPAYLSDRAARLGLGAAWQRIQREAEPLS